MTVVKGATAVEEWLRRHHPPGTAFTVREAYRALAGQPWAREGGSDAVRSAVRHLENRGVVRRVWQPPRPGRPSLTYEVR